MALPCAMLITSTRCFSPLGPSKHRLILPQQPCRGYPVRSAARRGPVARSFGVAGAMQVRRKLQPRGSVNY
jgi:hypothetical protein